MPNLLLPANSTPQPLWSWTEVFHNCAEFLCIPIYCYIYSHDTKINNHSAVNKKTGNFWKPPSSEICHANHCFGLRGSGGPNVNWEQLEEETQKNNLK